MPTRRAMVAGLGAVTAGLGGCTPAGPTTLPEVKLPGLPGLERFGWPVPGIGLRQFRAVTLLNVWASWCPYCRGEHAQLMALLGDDRFALVGLVHQDRPEAASAFLRRAGNPYAAVSADDGRLARALGQSGVPSSYVVDRTSRVVARWPGALHPAALAETILPALAKARLSA